MRNVRARYRFPTGALVALDAGARKVWHADCSACSSGGAGCIGIAHPASWGGRPKLLRGGHNGVCGASI